MLPLRDFITIRSRYTRSVNLERDLTAHEATEGYLPTPRVLDILGRIGRATLDEHAVRAWAVTSVYGTGKSAFAQFLTALYAPQTSPLRKHAMAVLRMAINDGHGVQREHRAFLARLAHVIPVEGYVRAVATCRREQLGQSVLRALGRGVEHFWAHRKGRRPSVVQELTRWCNSEAGTAPPSDSTVLRLLTETAKASGRGVLLVLDELGKALEAAALRSDASDLYLLQQIAEASGGATQTPILFVTLQHQELAAYAGQLSQTQQQEWEKVSGRFEQVPFQEPPEEMLRLIARVIVQAPSPAFRQRLSAISDQWHAHLSSAMGSPYLADVLNKSRVSALYPLHPVAAIVLPSLCMKFAQNDRSLFSFLASSEPHSLARFVAEHAVADDSLPVLKLPELYDYFVAAAGAGGRIHMQRWLEVQAAIAETHGLTLEEESVLKTIGTLNLVASAGPLRASRALVIAALVASPTRKADRKRWETILDGLAARGILTHRERIDEYRLWEGTDFDVRGLVADRMARETRTLAVLLDELAPQPPTVAERHSYRTGTLRLFETRFVDKLDRLGNLTLRQASNDGVIVYWLNKVRPSAPPHSTKDGRPVAFVPVSASHSLETAVSEAAALRDILREEPALRTDGVARKEVIARLRLAEDAVQLSLREAIAVAIGPEGEVWIGGQIAKLAGRRAFNSALSRLCDSVYERTPVLWNELINRRELTSQGARARRELLEVMLLRAAEPRLGLTGNGPEVSVFRSTLEIPGIHSNRAGVGWTFAAPHTESGLSAVWQEIERFCLDSQDRARTLDKLYEVLAAPPFGVKAGVIPVLLASVLIAHSQDISVYREGTFLPVLAAEHFEVLVKHPDWFAVKSFALEGVHADVFQALGELIEDERGTAKVGERNTTLLAVVRPLVRFATELPPLARRSTRLSANSIAVRAALLSAREPDELVFSTLPTAVGLSPIGAGGASWDVELFRKRLHAALQQLANFVDRTLDHSRTVLVEAFGIQSSAEHLREDLRIRAQYLSGRVVEPRLRRFVIAAIDPLPSDYDWLKAVVMVAADRPIHGWSDADADAFELQVADLARRFQTLEALQRDGAVRRDSADVRRVSLTDSGGHEILGLVWIDENDREKIERVADHVKALLGDLPTAEMREALLVRVLEDLMVGQGTAPDLDSGSVSLASGRQKEEKAHG